MATTIKEIEFENSNLYLTGVGYDSNGNKVVKVMFPNQKAFSIQTVGNLPKTSSIVRGIKKLNEIDENDYSVIESEVIAYIKEYGSNNQKQSLKVYKKFAKGGSVNGYKGKTAEDVWNNWSVEQRRHFLKDHNIEHSRDRLLHISAYRYNEMPKDLLNIVKPSLNEHVAEGQYAQGGSTTDPETQKKIKGLEAVIANKNIDQKFRDKAKVELDRIMADVEKVEAKVEKAVEKAVKPEKKVNMKTVTILWAEGDNSTYDTFPKNYTTYSAANDAVKKVYYDTVKSGDGGYNKVKFKVTFEDGEEYDGRLDVSDKEDNPTETPNVIGQHIREYLEYLMNKDEQTKAPDKQEIREWLAKYNLEDKAKSKPATKAAPKKKPIPKAPEKKIKDIDLAVAKAVEPKGGASRRAKVVSKPKAKVEPEKPKETPKRTKKTITSTKRKKAAATEKPKRKKKVITSAKRKKAAMVDVPTSKRGLAADKKREALPVGKRTSAAGNVYYEYRRNRADRNAKRKLAKGGEVESAFKYDELKIIKEELKNKKEGDTYRAKVLKGMEVVLKENKGTPVKKWDIGDFELAKKIAEILNYEVGDILVHKTIKRSNTFFKIRKIDSDAVELYLFEDGKKQSSTQMPISELSKYRLADKEELKDYNDLYN